MFMFLQRFYASRVSAPGRQTITLLEATHMDQKSIADMSDEIRRLKAARNAVIVAHNYQNDEVQDIADAVGDSFYLSRYCAGTDARTIVFCGVRFMAESAKILSPGKTVLLPEAQAGCPMADMVTPEDIRALRAQHPGAAVVCYINSSAAVKAECDICCTSSNAVKVVRSVAQKEVIFVPDQNLGRYVAQKVPEKELVLFSGYCATHQRFGLGELEEARKKIPDAPAAVHPECARDVTEHADFVGSTSEIIDFCKASDAKRFLIGTEMGVLRKLKKDNPGKQFYLITPRLVCSNMKLTTLASVLRALEENRCQIEVPEEIRRRACGCLERMLRV